MAKGKNKKNLRHGYTTGACATAATKAALLALIKQTPIDNIEIKLPIGDIVNFTISNLNFSNATAEAGVIKDAGDDPDVTHGALIKSAVSWLDQQEIIIDGGVGVGRVTKPGLPVPVGKAAINPVPQRMIREAAEKCLKENDIKRGVKIIISVPEGEELAKKTLNPRLGIIGGISILGSRGTVIPYSTSAYKASIVQAIRVAKINGINQFILTTGSSSEKIAQQIFFDTDQAAFIQMGEFVGFSLQHLKRQRADKAILVGMIGKLSKIAQGVMMVHSKNASIDFKFLAQAGKDIGAGRELQEKILNANTAAYVEKLIKKANLPQYFDYLCQLAGKHALEHIKGGLRVETILVSRDGRILGRVEVDG